MHHFPTRTAGSLGSRKLAGAAKTLLAQKVVLCEVGARFLGGTFEKVPPITPSKLSKRKFWDIDIGKVCALPFCFAHWICQHVYRFSTRAFRALGSRKRLGTTNPIRSESCFV